MRWNSASPNLGDTRVLSKFLFLPKRMYNTTKQYMETRWLERASWTQTYSKSRLREDWRNTRWHRDSLE